MSITSCIAKIKQGKKNSSSSSPSPSPSHILMRRPRYLFVDLTDKLFQRAERCRIHIVPRHLINGIGHNNLPTPLQSKPHKIAAQLIFLDKGQARHANQTVQSSEMRVEKHEGDFDPAGPVARIRDVVEDTAEVPLDVFALDV